MTASVGPQRRAVDQATTPGRCANLNFCSIGMQRIQVRVPISQPFVCPECSSPLRAPSRMARQEGQTRLLPVPIHICMLVAGMAAAGAAGFRVGRENAPVQAASHAVPEVAARPLARPVPPVRAARDPDPAPAFGATTLPPVRVIQAHPYPRHALPLDQVAPEQRLPSEVKAGQVAIDCVAGSAMFRPACHLASARGTDAFSDAALAWLGKLPVRYAAGPAGAAPVTLDHRWRVVFEDFSAATPVPAPAGRAIAAKKH